jgi:hypothetical protein
MAENKLDGLYKTRRDGGLLYSYHLTWITKPDGADWRATVVLARRVAGTPSGHLAAAPGANLADLLEKLVIHYIEHQVGVR